MADLLERAKSRFKLCQESEAEQRKRENEDLKFQVPEFQWDEAAKEQRKGKLVADVPVPARPMLSIDKLAQPIQLILNQARSARLGVNIHPVSEDANKEIAEVKQGLYRRIERDSNADQARLWALDRATKCGRGAYRINTKWDEDSDPKYFDQEIIIERILYQDGVYFDPAATKPDFSDGEFVFVVGWYSLDAAAKEFPDANLDELEGEDSLEWESLVTSAPEWVDADGDRKSILVAEYWYKEHTVKTIKSVDGKRERKLDIVSVKLAKITGDKILEEQEWMGTYIPIIPVLGRELQPFESERRWVGMIGPARDGQRFYNYAASSLVERMSLEPKAPYIMAEGQEEGHQLEWQQANTRNFPYLRYKPTTIGDKPAPPPERSQIDQSGMSLSMMAMQEADRFIQAATSVYDPSLGRENPRDKSGKAILALQQQSDAGTSHFLSSLADVSMPYEARVVLDLMPHVYDRPGRITTILKGDDDDANPVMINAPFVVGPDGRPQPAPEGMEGQGQVKNYDLTKGGYAISVDIGKSFQTRLQAGSDAIGQLMQSAPDLLPIVSDLFFRFQDFPGAQEIADRLKKVYDKAHPDDQEEGTPEQAQAKIASMNQAMQEMQQQLQQAMQELQTDQAKQQAQVEQARIKAETDLKLAEMKNATEIAVAQINAEVKGLVQVTQDRNEAIALNEEHAFKATEADKERAHDVAMEGVKAKTAEKEARMGEAHEAGMGAMKDSRPKEEEGE